MLLQKRTFVKDGANYAKQDFSVQSSRKLDCITKRSDGAEVLKNDRSP